MCENSRINIYNARWKDGKSKEIKHVTDSLNPNGYPLSIISNILKKKHSTERIPTPEELVGMFFKWAKPSNTS